MAVAEHLCAQPTAGGDTEAVRRALSAAIEEAVTHQKRQPFGVCAGSVTGAPCRSTSLPSAAAAPRRIGPKTGSMATSVAKLCTSVGERKRPPPVSAAAGPAEHCDCVVAVLSGSSEPARAMNILSTRGVNTAPPPSGVNRCASLRGRWRRLPLRRVECAPTQH